MSQRLSGVMGKCRCGSHRPPVLPVTNTSGVCACINTQANLCELLRWGMQKSVMCSLLLGLSVATHCLSFVNLSHPQGKRQLGKSWQCATGNLVVVVSTLRLWHCLNPQRHKALHAATAAVTGRKTGCRVHVARSLQTRGLWIMRPNEQKTESLCWGHLCCPHS